MRFNGIMVLLPVLLALAACRPGGTGASADDAAAVRNPTVQVCTEETPTEVATRTIAFDFSENVHTEHQGAGGNTTGCPGAVRNAMVSLTRQFCEQALDRASIDYRSVTHRDVADMDCNCDGGPGSCHVRATLVCETAIRLSADDSAICAK